MSEAWEKKTGRMEIRLEESKKDAFQSACDRQGDTTSNAIRRFIDSYIRRARRDDRAFTFHFLLRSVWQNKLKMGSVLAVLSAAIWGLKITTAPKVYNINYRAFAAFDQDDDGVIRPGDIREDDVPIFKVLDLDASGGIEREEFHAEGVMSWAMVDSFMQENDPGLKFRTQSSDTRDVQRDILKASRAVTFRLKNKEDVLIHTSELQPTTIHNPEGSSSVVLSGLDRQVYYERGKQKPVLVLNSGGFE